MSARKQQQATGNAISIDELYDKYIEGELLDLIAEVQITDEDETALVQKDVPLQKSKQRSISTGSSQSLFVRSTERGVRIVATVEIRHPRRRTAVMAGFAGMMVAIYHFLLAHADALEQLFKAIADGL